MTGRPRRLVVQGARRISGRPKRPPCCQCARPGTRAGRRPRRRWPPAPTARAPGAPAPVFATYPYHAPPARPRPRPAGDSDQHPPAPSASAGLNAPPTSGAPRGAAGARTRPVRARRGARENTRESECGGPVPAARGPRAPRGGRAHERARPMAAPLAAPQTAPRPLLRATPCGRPPARAQRARPRALPAPLPILRASYPPQAPRLGAQTPHASGPRAPPAPRGAHCCTRPRRARTCARAHARAGRVGRRATPRPLTHPHAALHGAERGPRARLPTGHTARPTPHHTTVHGERPRRARQSHYNPYIKPPGPPRLIRAPQGRPRPPPPPAPPRAPRRARRARCTAARGGAPTPLVWPTAACLSTRVPVCRTPGLCLSRAPPGGPTPPPLRGRSAPARLRAAPTPRLALPGPRAPPPLGCGRATLFRGARRAHSHVATIGNARRGRRAAGAPHHDNAQVTCVCALPRMWHLGLPRPAPCSVDPGAALPPQARRPARRRPGHPTRRRQPTVRLSPLSGRAPRPQPRAGPRRGRRAARPPPRGGIPRRRPPARGARGPPLRRSPCVFAPSLPKHALLQAALPPSIAGAATRRPTDTDARTANTRADNGAPAAHHCFPPRP